MTESEKKKRNLTNADDICEFAAKLPQYEAIFMPSGYLRGIREILCQTTSTNPEHSVIEITISYTDPETGKEVSEVVRIFADQLYHFLEFAEEMNEETKGY